MVSEDERGSDEQLLGRWRGGEQAAGATLLERHHDSVARFFMYKLGPDSKDLVQATFLGLLEGLERFRGEASFRTLLFAIARKQLLKHLRNRVRDRNRFRSDEVSLVDLAPSPISAIVVHERHKLLLAGLRRLPIDTQLLIELHYWEKLKLRELAEILDLPINTVKTRMRRGRVRLEAELRVLADSPEQLETTLRGLRGWAEELRLAFAEEAGPGAGDIKFE